MKQDNKIIIKNQSALSIGIAFNLVREVIKAGKVSENNTTYAYATRFTLNTGNQFIVYCQKNKASFTFTIVDN